MRSRISIIIIVLFTITTYISLTAATTPVAQHVVKQPQHNVAQLAATSSLPSTTLPPTTLPTTTTPPTTIAPAPDLYAAWTRVAVCEEGGWIGRSGDAYPNSLGITAANWYANGGGSDYSPAAQIAVAERLRASVGMSIPDQNGCGAW